MRRVRVALAQVNPTVGAIEANARLVMAGMDRARALGCDIVAFPELALTGYPPEDLLFKPAFIEANLRALADVAAREPRPHRGRRLRGQARRHLQRGGRPARRRAGRRLPQAVPAELRRVRREPLLPGRHRGAGVHAGRDASSRSNICEDIWYPTGPTTRQALARRRAGGEHQRLALPRGQGAPPRADAGHPRRRRRRVPGLRQHGGRPGRAGLRRRQPASSTSSGESVARGQASSRRTSSSPTSTSTRSSTRACTTRGGARRSCAPPRPSRAASCCPPRPRAGAAGAAAARRGAAAGAGGRGLPGAGARHPRLRRARTASGTWSSGCRAASTPRWWRPSRCDALGAENVTGVTMPSPYSSSGTRGDAERLATQPRHRLPDACRSRRCFTAFKRDAGRALQGAQGGRGRGEHPGAHPRQLLMALSQQVRLAGADHRQQERDRGRLLDPLRRHGGRLRGHQGRAEDAGLRGRRTTSTRAAGRAVIPQSVFDRAPSAELRPDQTDQDTLPPYADARRDPARPTSRRTAA